jgi:ABC-type nitrate/sulfonate/bicarbonate transport system ATPase subunit
MTPGRTSNGLEPAPERPTPAHPRTGEPAVVALHEVAFSYPDGTQAIDGISLSVGLGRIVGIVGPSGCGKSTLLSLIAGLAVPTRGDVDLSLPDPSRHPLSMVFQKNTVLPWLTVAENVNFYARFRSNGGHTRLRNSVRGLWGLARRERHPHPGQRLDERAAELLAMIGLADKGDVYPYQLSGGMRRRLAFLTAVAADPQILLLDEPFSSVDEPTRIGIHQDVFRIARTMGMTTLLVTHDLAEAITLCDTVLILSNRPAQIVRRQETGFGEDRQMLELRETPKFLDLYAGLWHELTTQIQRGEEVRQ